MSEPAYTDAEARADLAGKPARDLARRLETMAGEERHAEAVARFAVTRAENARGIDSVAYVTACKARNLAAERAGDLETAALLAHLDADRLTARAREHEEAHR